MARKIGSRYTAHQILGRGSAGTVWLGEGPDGPVAVKLLREDLASDEELVGRFVQERTALLGLEHPNIVSVRDLVVDGNDLALVMDLVRGTDLRTRLERERRLAPEAAVAIVADVAEGLAAAHAAGVVHRDVKPENILLDMQGPLGPGGSHRALLTDFGVAKLIDTPKRTRSTKIIGTPDYLAPEIVEGLPPRAAVDIYALATVLYELLAGFTPFGGGHPGAVLRRHVTETVVPLPGIPDELWQLLVQCLAKAPRLPAARLRAGGAAARAAAHPRRYAAAGRGRARRGRRRRRSGAGRRHRPGDRRTRPRGRPGGAAGGRAGTAGGRAPRARRQARLQPRHPHLDAGARPRRAGRRGARHGAGAPGCGGHRVRAPRATGPPPAGAGSRSAWPAWCWRRPSGWGGVGGGVLLRRRRRQPYGAHGPGDPLTGPARPPRPRSPRGPGPRAAPVPVRPRCPCGPGARAAPAPGPTARPRPPTGCASAPVRPPPLGGAVTLEAWQSSMYPKSSSPSPRPWSRSRPFWTSTS
ncbi:hypothetical protein GCM10020256_47590 [Streptomyces thermocoprophilus]